MTVIIYTYFFFPTVFLGVFEPISAKLCHMM